MAKTEFLHVDASVRALVGPSTESGAEAVHRGALDKAAALEHPAQNHLMEAFVRTERADGNTNGDWSQRRRD